MEKKIDFSKITERVTTNLKGKLKKQIQHDKMVNDEKKKYGK